MDTTQSWGLMISTSQATERFRCSPRKVVPHRLSLISDKS